MLVKGAPGLDEDLIKLRNREIGSLNHCIAST